MRPSRARHRARVGFVATSALALFLLPGPALAQSPDVTVSPITAYVDLATSSTEYTVQVGAPIGADLSVVWSTPSCGTWTTPVPTLFRWTHEHPPCTDELLHPDVVITVVVTVVSADVEFTCRYRGADSGTGKPCARRSLGLAPSPSPSPTSASPAPTSSAAPTPTDSAGGLPVPPVVLVAAGGVAALVLVAALALAITRRTRRRREALLDPCGPRYRRGLAYLAGEIEAYAACNREAFDRAVASSSLGGTRSRVDLGDLWEASPGEVPAWAGVVAGEGLIRPVRDPAIVAAATPGLGPDGPWRSSAEKVAPRIVP